jgi:ferredoxin
LTYVIGDGCIGTMERSCVDVCPVDCIIETAQMMVIDPNECIDCSACEVECPVQAITADDEAGPEWEPWITINAAIADGVDVVNRLVAAQRGADA